MNPNYTIENFEKWLNEDKKRKRGLWFWGQVIEKVKSDSDLFNALATGQEQGGWNISDPEFRKQYQFEDYYWVFVEWKKEVDTENDDETEKPNEEETEDNEETPIPPKPNKKIILEEIISELQTKKITDCEILNNLEWAKFSIKKNKIDAEERKKIGQSIVENLKKDQTGWSIRKITTLDYFGREDYQTNELLIIHQSAPLKYDKNEMLIFDRKLMWEKDFFTTEQQKELEKIIPFSSEELQTNNIPWGKITLYSGGGIVVLVILYKLIKRYFF